MPTVDTKDAKGAKAGSVELDDAMFGVQPNVPVMHQVVTAQLAAKRSGIKEIILPKENEANVRQDIPEHLQRGLQIRYVKTIGEVIELALQPAAAPRAVGIDRQRPAAPPLH